MAVIVVAYPFRVFSTSPAAKAAPVGVRHLVTEFEGREEWHQTESGYHVVIAPGVRTACGHTLAYSFDDPTERKSPRPAESCKLCARAKPTRLMTSWVEVTGAGWNGVRVRHVDTAQQSLLS